jgi:ferredoxin
MIDGKARMVDYLFCDGLGACIGQCPVGAIRLEEKEVKPYNETAVMERLVLQGEATIVAHLIHLKQHGEFTYLAQGLDYLQKHDISIDMSRLEETKPSFIEEGLRKWPLQLHLLNPQAAFLRNADLVLAADCTAYACGRFHEKFVSGNVITIACPKLDAQKEAYVEKLAMMIDLALIRSLHVVIMEVPCCSGLMQLAQAAVQKALRSMDIRKTVITISGEIRQVEH